MMRQRQQASEGDVSATETVGELAYRRMRADIIFGPPAPGEKLRLDRVSQTYGASVSTMRELLNRLGSEGLIVAEGQRGFEVAPVSPDDFREVAAMRQLLECHAIEQSFAAGDLDWEGRVVAAHHKLAVTERRMIAGDRTDPEIVEAMRLGVPSRLDLGLRIEGPAADARGDLRQVSSLPNDCRDLPRRDRSTRAS